MNHASRDVVSALKKKGFEKTARKDHSEFEVPGTLVRTHVSNGASYEVGGHLRKAMATQMHLTASEFDDFVSCTVSEAQYRKILIGKALLLPDPQA